jgi:hypothetical protein
LALLGSENVAAEAVTKGISIARSFCEDLLSGCKDRALKSAYVGGELFFRLPSPLGSSAGPDGYVEVDRVQVVAADAFAAQSGAGAAGGPVVDVVVVG